MSIDPEPSPLPWMKQLAFEIGTHFVSSLKPAETYAKIAALIQKHTPPVSQRATGEEWLVTYDNDTGPDDDSFTEWWNVSDGTIIYRSSTEADAKRLCETLNATPRSLPHGPEECSPVGKALIMGDMQIMEGETPGDYTGIFVEFTRADLRKMKWNPMYQPVRLVPAVDGSKGAS